MFTVSKRVVGRFVIGLVLLAAWYALAYLNCASGETIQR